jgi:acetyl-CoA hydrolase
MSESVIDLIKAGALTNRYKLIDPGLCVAGGCLGTKRLYDWLHRRESVYMQVSDYTHNAAVLMQIDNLVAINSAVEIDLTGQVNAESIGPRYIGATGGQGDFQRAAVRSPTGRAIIALPSVAGRARKSRIVAQLSGPVTTPRSDIDVIVTEHGIAELHGRTLAERARAMIAIADPEHRAALDRAAGEGLY